MASAISLGSASPALAYTAYVTNERDNTVSVVDLDKMQTVKTIQVGQRPRGIVISPDGKFLYICAGDDDIVQIIDTKTQEVVGDLPSGPDPELLALNKTGDLLYLSNENDALVTIIDVKERKALAQIPVGVEPEGMGVSPDGKIVVNTSETTNMAHFIDTDKRDVVANVLVDARPRYAEWKSDGSEVWVSAEVGGTVSVIDPAKHVVTGKITFSVPGLRSEAIQPVGIRFTKDGKLGLRGAWPGEPRCGRGCADASGREISSRRPARLATRLHAGSEISDLDEWGVERYFDHRCREPQGDQERPGRKLPLGRRDLAGIEP